MSSNTGFIIQSIPFQAKAPALYWTVVETDRGRIGVWGFEITDAERYKSVAAAWEYATAYGGLKLSDDQFHILPYIY
jgi:hypothetical protein